MIVDPWGRVLASLDSGPGIVVAEVDPAVTARVRADLPALEHRRELSNPPSATI
jgi:nitrilase